MVYLDKGANFSDDGKYRYELWRMWDDTRPFLYFVMLNPSVAGAEKDDPTIRKCVGFADRLGYGMIVVLNVFALCSTDPRALVAFSGDRIGPKNRLAIAEIRGNPVVVGWGGWGNHQELLGGMSYVKQLIRLQKPKTVHCLGFTKSGQPRHPLMLPYTTKLERFEL